MEKAGFLSMASLAALSEERQTRPAIMFFRTMALFGRLKDSPFVRNVLVVMSGSVFAQAIGFALSPIISRLFTPADFGAFGSFGAVTGVIASIVTLDYSQAIMLPREREDAGQVFLLSCLATLTVTVLCAAACLLAPNWLTGLLTIRSHWVLALVVLAVLAAGLNGSCQAWCVRIKSFKQTSASQVVRGLSSNGLQVVLGVARSGAPGLIVSSVLADFLASLNLVRVIRTDLRSFISDARWGRLKQLATDYGDFPAYSATQNLLNALSTGLPVLLLTHYFDISVAGAYAFGMRLLNAPMSLLFGALRQVLFQKAGEMQHHGLKLLPLFVKTTVGLFGLGLLPAIVLGTWSPQLFTWIFGNKWQSAGEFARYLVIWLLLSFCNLPAVLFARLIRIQRALFFYNSIVLAVRAVALVLGGLYLTALQSVALFSLVGAVLNLALILFVGHALLKREGELSLKQLRDGLAGSPLE
jgi:O-antigen/teichoic acid export membrane protein